jgi:drug/metabolite transporter (DMT)-like permease
VASCLLVVTPECHPSGWNDLRGGRSVAYGSYLWLLKASTPAKAATCAYVNLVIALLLGYLLGDESLSAWTMGCSAAVVAAVLLVVTSPSVPRLGVTPPAGPGG